MTTLLLPKPSYNFPMLRTCLLLLIALYFGATLTAQNWEEWSISLRTGISRNWVERPVYLADTPPQPDGEGVIVFTGTPRVVLTGHRTDLELRYGTGERTVFGIGASFTRAVNGNLLAGSLEFPGARIIQLRDNVRHNAVGGYFSACYRLTPSFQRVDWQVGAGLHYVAYNVRATERYTIQDLNPGGLTVTNRRRERRYDTTKAIRAVSRWEVAVSARVKLDIELSGGIGFNDRGDQFDVAGQLGLSYSLTGAVPDF